MSKVNAVYIFLKGEEGNTDGSKTYVEVTFQRYMLGSYNSSTNKQTVYLYFGLYIQARGASSGGEQSQNTQITFSLNGIRRETDADKYNQILTYEVDGPLTSITIEKLYAEGRSNIAAGPLKTNWVGVEFLNATITPVNVTSNLNVITLGTTKNTTKHLILPNPATYIGKPIFVKIKDDVSPNYIDNARQLVWIYPYRGSSRIDDTEYLWNGYSGIVLTISKTCMTFITDGSNWYIVGYYNNFINFTGTNITDPLKLANASTGVNVFSVNKNSARTSGDNQVILPLEEAGKMCIVIYAGDDSSKGGGNALSFKTTSGNGIDNRFNNTNNFPYISSDASYKSSGIVFISDGTYWYIVGWYEPFCQGWQNNAATTSTQLIPSSYVNFNYTPGTLSSDTFYTLPQYTAADAGKSYLYIFKSTNVSGGTGIVLCANPAGTGTNPPTSSTSVFNETENIVYKGCNRKSYQFIWVVSEIRSNEQRFHWYPVLNDYNTN